MTHCYRHLSAEDRAAIMLTRAYNSIRTIARQLGRAPSTISRELARHTFRPDNACNASLATKHAVPESTVCSRAKSEGWQRDLTREVRAATRAKLSRTSRSDTAHEGDAAIIEQASNEVADMVSQHLRAIARWRDIAECLAGTLAEMPIDEANHDKFARSLISGIDALGKTIKLERQAFNIGEESGGEDLKSLEELMDEVAPHEMA